MTLTRMKLSRIIPKMYPVTIMITKLQMLTNFAQIRALIKNQQKIKNG